MNENAVPNEPVPQPLSARTRHQYCVLVAIEFALRHVRTYVMAGQAAGVGERSLQIDLAHMPRLLAIVAKQPFCAAKRA